MKVDHVNFDIYQILYKYSVTTKSFTKSSHDVLFQTGSVHTFILG